MSLAEHKYSYVAHPVDVMEAFAVSQEWTCEREADDEINVFVAGIHCDYHFAISWQKDLEGLHIANVMNLVVPEKKYSDVCMLLALINAQALIGHFDIWLNDGTLVFRNTLLIDKEKMDYTWGQKLFFQSIGFCEQFFPAFQYVVLENYTPQAAINACLFETQGDA